MKSYWLYFVPAFWLLFATPALQAQSGKRNLLLPGATVEQAERELGKTLQNLANASQVELTQIRTIKQSDQQVPPNMTKVTIQMDSNCSFDQLVRFLEAIRSYEKFLQVEELTINSFRTPEKTWVIHSNLKVSGFVENAPLDGAGTPLFRPDRNLEILRELTGLLPPDSVVINYRNQDCTIQLVGLFPPYSSFELMEKLEKSPLLKDVTTPGTIFLDSQTGRERAMFSAKCEE